MSTEAAPKDHLIPPGDARRVPPNFITDIIDEDLLEGRVEQVVTRWPPEPNGYLHIGHAKSFCLNFGLAQDYGGRYNLRFDDTNPTAEEMAYVEAIQRDIRWLGFDWDDNLFFASDYFDKLYKLALQLIGDGKAYVDSLSEEDIRTLRGTVTEPGSESPYRGRSVAENLELFKRMRSGEFDEGTHVLRAKIDMASPNMKLRDPILYRILRAPHYRTGTAWPIYPMYDFQHPLSDALEGVTHSLCTLEFENNRAVYNWLVDSLFGKPRPYQYEFGRHNIEYTVLGKRNLITLVKGGFVTGWDDPRLPTLAGLRRRGVTPEAIKDFNHRIGVSRQNSTTSIALLEHSIRDDLNFKAPRVMAVLEPLKVTLTNYPDGKVEPLTASYWPHDVPNKGSREVPFSRELYIERDDFAERPPKGFKRLSPGVEVRLRYAYVIRCDEVIKGEDGTVTELRCTYHPDTLGEVPAGRVKGIIHWVSAEHALEAEFRLYDRLFSVPNPTEGERPFTDFLNPESLVVKRGFVEPSVLKDPERTRYQFERQGYFWRDEDSSPDALVFNRIVTLRDTWAKTLSAEAHHEAQKKEAQKKLASRDAKPAPQTADARDPAADLSSSALVRFESYAALGLGSEEAAVLAGDEALGNFFERARDAHDNPHGIASWLVNDLQHERKGTPLEDLAVTPEALAELVALIDEGTISARIAKEVFARMLKSGGSPREIVKKRGLEQVSDADTLAPVVDRLVAGHPDKAAAYRNGKTGLLGFFVGQVMRETKGKANPQTVQELVKRSLE